MKSSLIAFVKKEFIHISRDKRTMMILLLMPVILIILFGYAIRRRSNVCLSQSWIRAGTRRHRK